jgi:hypothetical protein
MTLPDVASRSSEYRSESDGRESLKRHSRITYRAPSEEFRERITPTLPLKTLFDKTTTPFNEWKRPSEHVLSMKLQKLPTNAIEL